MTNNKENIFLLKKIQKEVGSSGTDQYFHYTFNIGSESIFQIQIKGGELGNSEPCEILESLSDYETFNIQIWQNHNTNKEDLPSSEPIEISGGGSYYVSTAWKTLPSPVFPQTDERFTSQPWAKKFQIAKTAFNIHGATSYLMATPDEACDIIRYCSKITELKVFW